ncbi:MAG: DUF1735 domain-containing protein [Chitinophagaceae bacterium]|nr:DUF1735 domain-containing protein [Chitinophagaceae bacterium]
MRKVLSYLPVIMVVSAITGCLKDKDYEDQKYGLQVKEVKGVAFPQSASSPIVYGINSQTTPQTVDGPFVALEEDKAPTSPVNVTLQIDQTLVTDLGFTALGPTDFSINSLTVAFAAGQKLSDAVKITIPNSSTLDPTKSYGVGLVISAVDQGYKVASNQKTVVVAFNIKNQYDGKYSITWTNYHPSLNPGYTGSTSTVELHTSGPNSVKMFWPLADAYCIPAILGGGPSYFGAQEPNYTVSATNVVTVQNVASGAVTFYSMAPGYSSRYDPVAKKFYAKFGYGTGYPPFDPAASREWTQEFTYTGPR